MAEGKVRRKSWVGIRGVFLDFRSEGKILELVADGPGQRVVTVEKVDQIFPQIPPALYPIKVNYQTEGEGGLWLTAVIVYPPGWDGLRAEDMRAVLIHSPNPV
jgi:hypothetical protein